MDILTGTHLLRWKQKEEINAIEQIALSYWQMHRVTFKFLKVTDKEVTIGITQVKHKDEQYLTQKDLIDIVHKVYDKSFPGHRIVVHASPYKESPALKVDSSWIKKKMEEHNVALKDIVEETGLNKTQLSVLINGGKPLSDAMKAMFYFYFRSKEVKE